MLKDRQRADPGFRTDDALLFGIGLPVSAYPTREAAASFHEQLLERLQALPGVQHAGVTTQLPLDGLGAGDPLAVHGAPPDANCLLFGVAPRDVATYGAVAIGLFVVALIACWLPARRAARVSPLASLNQR